MSAFLTFDSVSAATPERQPLFDDLSLSIGTERVGLVGRNGSGKSTLLRIASGEIDATAGTVQRRGTLGTLAQEWPEKVTLTQALGIADAMATLERILAGKGSPADLDAADWTLEARIEAALERVGLPGTSLDRTMGTYSGGERTRIGIARLLIEAPDLLLLDEPTNNLDAEGRSAIGSLIRDWQGGVLVASHDRALLEAMDRIVELTPLGVRIVGGGWSAFAEVREAERARAEAERDRADAELRQVRRTVQHQREARDRRNKAGRAAAARGSEPKIVLGARAENAENSGGRARHVSERLMDEAAVKAEAARAKVEVLTPLTMDLPPSGLPSRAQLLSLTEITAQVGNRRLGPWTLEITGPERVAICGTNGTGKTTLLKVARGTLVPETGSVRRSQGPFVLLDQHVAILDRNASVLANFRRLNPGLDDQAAHAACARFSFRNRDALQSVGTLSGGERLRAGLACTLAGEHPPWLLMLDEPTNHLDIESVEVLEQALHAFDGALLVTSHDTAFLKAIGIERTIKVSDKLAHG